MLFTSKNKSDANLKGQRMQRFLRENINLAKNKTVNSKGFAKLDTREGTPVIPRHARSVTSGKHKKLMIGYEKANGINVM